MRRRGLGVGQIHSKQKQTSKYEEHVEQLSSEQLVRLSQQMESFNAKLQDFAKKHKRDIKKDPEFRREFQVMCSNVGVDPLSSSTSFWSKMLGIGDFYFEIGMQTIEICVASHARTGGIMDIKELYRQLQRLRSRNPNSELISMDDVVRSVEKISALGTGVRLIKCGDSFVVNSVSSELNIDQNEVVRLATLHRGCVTVRLLAEKLRWSEEKADKILREFEMNGLVWVDEFDAEISYWFPGLFIQSK